MPLDVNNPNAVRAYGMEYEVQTLQDTFMWRNNLLKPVLDGGAGGDNAPLWMSDALGTRKPGTAGAGWQEVIPFLGAAEGYATTGNNPIAGSETIPKQYSDVVQINTWRKAVISPGPFSDQIGLRPHRDICLTQQKDYWPVHYDNHIIAKLTGSVGNSSFVYFDAAAPVTSARDEVGSLAADGNDLRPSSATRTVYGTAASGSTGLATTDTLSAKGIERCIAKALVRNNNTTTNRVAKPLSIQGQRAAILLADWSCINDLMESTSSRFFLQQQAMTQGGKGSAITDSMPDLFCIYLSPTGLKVYILPHPDLIRYNASTLGPDGGALAVKAISNLMLFRHAGHMVVGKDAKELPMYNIYEEFIDAGGKFRATASNNYGFQKVSFSTTETGTTRQDYGVINYLCYSNF